ncbi:MAG TPA: helix-turn-helix domain-containing protein [Clostridiaceae bacterium]
MEILSLGVKIKRRRKDLNMTLKDLAGVRITPGQISLVESGKSNPSMDLLEYLASRLNVSIEYIMESEESQAEKICVYYENISEACILNNELIQVEQYIEKSLFYAEKYNLEYRKAKNLYLRGLVFIEKKELGPAQQLFLSANVIFIKGGHYEDIINTSLKLGIITLDMKAYNSSSSYFQQAEKVYIENDTGNDFLLGEIYYYIAITFLKLDELEKAINYSFLAKKKFEQVNEKKEYAKTLLLIAKEYNVKGDLDKAIKYSKLTLNIFRELKELDYVSEIENSLGKLFYDFGNVEESFVHLNIAKEIRLKNKDSKLTETLIRVCENFIKLKDIDMAKKTLEEILDQIHRGNNQSLLDYYLVKFKVDMLQQNRKDAETTLITALNYTKAINSSKDEAEVSIMLGKFYIDSGDDSEAAKYLNSGVELFRELKILVEL